MCRKEERRSELQMSLIGRDAEHRMSRDGSFSLLGSSALCLQGGSHTQAFGYHLSDVTFPQACSLWDSILFPAWRSPACSHLLRGACSPSRCLLCVG